MNASSVEVLRQYGYSIILWDKELDSRDWERPGVQKILDRVVNYARPGGIILMHDGGGNRSQTVAALPKILKQLGDQGYHFVTVSELLNLGDVYQNGAPR
jgi:peptidoglycan/xylan/chitin deacetylase (PgdA/CDA1 family)